MKAYKAFNKDMTCHGFQYEKGKSYETDVASLGHTGFHACLAPIDCLRYCKVSESVFHEVELGGVSDERGTEDTIICARAIKIGKSLSITEVVKTQIDFVSDQTKEEGHISSERWSTAAISGRLSTAATSGDESTAATSGDVSNVATSGYGSTAATSGRRSIAATSGYDSTAATSGMDSISVTSGYRSTSATSGDLSKSATFNNASTSATSGDYSTAATFGRLSTAATCGNGSVASTYGYGSTAATCGNWSASATYGKNSIAVANGVGSHGKGNIGSYIVLTEYDADGNMTAKMERVDGKRIKADTWYILRHGEFVEQKEYRPIFG